MHSPPEFPSRAEGLALHLRLSDQDPTAVADGCRAYLAPLLRWLTAHFPGVDPDHCQTAAHDALVAYVQRPQGYDAKQLDLGAYLRMAARRDVFNLVAKDQRHHQALVPW